MKQQGEKDAVSNTCLEEYVGHINMHVLVSHPVLLFYHVCTRPTDSHQNII